MCLFGSTHPQHPPPPFPYCHRPGKYLTGDTISHGDLAVFCSLSTLQSGWLDGECWAGWAGLAHTQNPRLNPLPPLLLPPRLLRCAAAAGVPSDLLASYPSLKAFRNAIASLPEVAAFYAKQDDDIRVKGFRADA
jgi:glutathione S-transferase